MSKTIVAVFDDTTSAHNAVRELERSGIEKNHIRVNSNSDAEPSSVSWREKIYSLFENILEHVGDRGQAHDYAEAWRRGHFIVIADVEAEQVDVAVDILNRFGTVDLDRRIEQWKSSGYSGEYDQTSQPYTTEQRQRELSLYQTEQTIPIVQMDLVVGKQTVRRGGVRIHSYVQERPVAERVRLREEQAAQRREETVTGTVRRKDIDVAPVDAEKDRATGQGGERGW